MKTITSFRSFATFHSRVVVVGAGAGGHSFISNVTRRSNGAVQPRDITVFDPSLDHIYQPYQTVIGGGVCKVSDGSTNVQNQLIRT